MLACIVSCRALHCLALRCRLSRRIGLCFSVSCCSVLCGVVVWYVISEGVGLG